MRHVWYDVPAGREDVQIEVRPARAEDKAAVLAFTTHTWEDEEGDYIHLVWNRWLRNRHGQMFVATADGQPVSVARVALQSRTEAWFEGMRVDPHFRRQGIAVQVQQACLAYARQQGCRVARLATGAENYTSQHLTEQGGFRRVAAFQHHLAPASAETVAGVRPATAADLPAILNLWRASAARPAAANLVPHGWSWQEMKEARLRRIVARPPKAHRAPSALVAASAAGEVSGFALYRTRYGQLLEINWLEGAEEAMRQLAQATRALAQERRLNDVACFAADHPPVRQALLAAGFQPEFEMWLYACEL
ncbi:MAG: GNAT family N-acetyltransferase [Chloroflexi bacterium]|nr:GNAT family N-acetyltransferase [Chloroflexota bacterium]